VASAEGTPDLTTEDRAQAVFVLRGGRVITSDGAATHDVFVVDGKIASEVPADRVGEMHVIDCAGALVVPGLVDLHGHVDTATFDAALPADEAHLRRGVVAVNDGGSVGADVFDRFRNEIVSRSRAHITCFLNASSQGIRYVLAGEYDDRSVLRVERAVDVARANPEIVRGIKVRLGRLHTGDDPIPVLEAGLKIAAEADLPLMAHIGDTACSLDEIIERLRPGDILTHCYHGKAEGILQAGHIRPTVLDARQRGILFDIGHGTTQLSYAVATAAIDRGFLPDTISSDLTHNNWGGPAFDLTTVMSKLIGLGMPLTDAIIATTATPAKALKLTGYGDIRANAPAHLTVMRQRDTAETARDGSGIEISIKRLEPAFVIDGADLIASIPRRDEGVELPDGWVPTPIETIKATA